MKVLIGYSRCPVTRAAFERNGIEAWTCDLLPAVDLTNRHIQCDVWEVANDNWDFGLFHPMCTYLTVSAAWAFNDPNFDRYPGVGYHQKVKPGTLVGEARREARREAIDNFKRILGLPYPKVIENPGASFISKAIRPADQLIQPYEFGEDASKLTGLWLDRAPKLVPTQRVPGRLVPVIDPRGKTDLHPGYVPRYVERWSNQTGSGQNRLTPSENRWLDRSKTYPGIANAFGDQWGAWLNERLAA